MNELLKLLFIIYNCKFVTFYVLHLTSFKIYIIKIDSYVTILFVQRNIQLIQRKQALISELIE